MAIEVIPKKPQAKPGDSANFLLYLSVILLLFSIISLPTLYFLKKNSEKLLEETKAEIAEKETGQRKAQEREVLQAQRKINDFLFLLDFRRENSQFFNSLANLTHPKVFFSKIDLRIKEGKVLLSGRAESPIVLGQQMLLFKKANYIKQINLEKVSISQEGGIEFDLDISFASEYFKY